MFRLDRAWCPKSKRLREARRIADAATLRQRLLTLVDLDFNSRGGEEVSGPVTDALSLAAARVDHEAHIPLF